MSSSELPYESRLKLQVRLYRPEQLDELVRAQAWVHADGKDTGVLSAYVGGETLQRASVVRIST